MPERTSKPGGRIPDETGEDENQPYRVRPGAVELQAKRAGSFNQHEHASGIALSVKRPTQRLTRQLAFVETHQTHGKDHRDDAEYDQSEHQQTGVVVDH